MIEATQSLDAILQGSRGKRKKTPLKAYYCDVDGEITCSRCAVCLWPSPEAPSVHDDRFLSAS
eukprot:scaffold1552_cov144-Isochrysis_galbana.AAC.3